MKKKVKDQRTENGKKTAFKVLSVAKQMFGRQGFAKTSTSDIVKQAGIARGGLYHHFSTKKEIFKAVFRMSMEEIAEKITFDKTAPEKKQHFLDVTLAFFKACLDPGRLQIVMIDAPSVLGIDEFRTLDEELLTAQLADYLEYLLENNIIKPINTGIMSHLLAGAANDAVLLIAQSNDKEKTLSEVCASFEILVDSFWK